MWSCPCLVQQSGQTTLQQACNLCLLCASWGQSSDSLSLLQVLDPALTRPGRLSRRVVVPLPDQAGRADILGVHLRRTPMNSQADKDLCRNQIARITRKLLLLVPCAIHVCMCSQVGKDMCQNCMARLSHKLLQLLACLASFCSTT